MRSGIQMTASGVIQSKQLEPLFEVQLQHKEGKPPVSTQGKVGEHIGSGEGTVSGESAEGPAHLLFLTWEESIQSTSLSLC